ncbi:hypothetical protein [Campylobacter concisus]|nr:hypothetical protein [Campylobacter concisus]
MKFSSRHSHTHHKFINSQEVQIYFIRWRLLGQISTKQPTLAMSK